MKLQASTSLFTTFLLVLSTIAPAVAQTLDQATAQAAINRFVSLPMFKHASITVGVQAVNADTLLAASNPDLSCITASTMKTVTSSAAILGLGYDYRFMTRIAHDGEIKGDKLRGNLYILGGGDPTLGSKYLPQQNSIVTQVINSLRERGIKKIEGKIIIPQSYPFPAYNSWWDVGDLIYDYGAGIHALNFADNVVQLTFTVKDGKVDGYRFTPSVPGLAVSDHLATHKGEPARMSLEYASPTVVLSGYWPDSIYTEVVANPIPEAMLADSLTRALKAAKIKVTDKDKEWNKEQISLGSYNSAPLNQILTSLLERSDNMFTDGVLRALIGGNSPSENNAVRTATNGVAVADSLLQSIGVDTEAKFQLDGSGLARANKASARFFLQMLTHMARQPEGHHLSPLLSKAGSMVADPDLRKDIALKSGSMTAVQCYVGYYPANTPKYAFAVLVNSWIGNRKSVQKAIGQLLTDWFQNK